MLITTHKKSIQSSLVALDKIVSLWFHYLFHPGVILPTIRIIAIFFVMISIIQDSISILIGKNN